MTLVWVGEKEQATTKDNRRSFDCGGKCAAFAQDDNFGGGARKEQATATAKTIRVSPLRRQVRHLFRQSAGTPMTILRIPLGIIDLICLRGSLSASVRKTF
jgi:hypothetical protein